LCHDPIANFDPDHAGADGRNFASAIAQRHDVELCRTATAALRTISSW
jgi:hypothetical protein